MKVTPMLRLQYIAEIDYCYYCLQDLNKQINKPQHPLERMIDDATGYTAEMTKRVQKEAIYNLKHIIKRKKQIGEDYRYDEKALSELSKIIA